MAKGFFIKDEINNHIKYYYKQYFYSVIVLFCGLLLAIILSLTKQDFLNVLNSKDQQVFDFITGNIKRIDIFYERLKNCYIYLVVIFLFNLSTYSSFLSFLFVGYQFFLVFISCFSIISIYGLTGVLLAIFLILPINLINCLVMVIYNVVLSKRVFNAKKYKLKFRESFKENNNYVFVLCCVLASIIISFFYSFILPLFIKNLAIIVY